MDQQTSFAPTKIIAIYARVSTARQEEDGTIETQLTALRDFARQHGYIVVKEYIDDGWSGDVIVRPSLDELRQDVKSKIWQAVLIYDPDRLARRYSYQELIMDELRESGVEVIFVTISAPKNSEEKILHGVRGLFAEYERAKIAERFRLGKIRKVREGHILTTEALYGYKYIPKRDATHGYYEINPEEARVVKMIFSWVVNERYTMRQIVRKLQERGIKPRKSKRNIWNTSTLATMLRHRAYIGEAHWGASYAVVPDKPTKTDKYRKTKKSSRRMRPEAEWHIIPVPAIIDEELFKRARLQLEANAALSRRNKKNEYLLAGKIRCVCGRTRCGEGPQQGKYLYYRCADRVLSFPLPPTCKERGVNARIADALVWNKISNLMSSKELLSEQAARWFAARHEGAKSSAGEVVAMEAEVAALRTQEARFIQAYGAGIVTLEQLRDHTLPIADKISSLRTQIASAQQNSSTGAGNEMPSPAELNRFAEEAKKMLHSLNFSARRAIVLNTVDKVVGTQKHLRVYGVIPIKDYVEFKTEHRHGLSATRHAGFHAIPFDLEIELPLPLRRGIDYGFLPGSNTSRASGSAGAP